MPTAREIKAAAKAAREARIEDIEFMVQMGEHPSRIARRIGINEASLRRFIERNKVGRRHPDQAA